MESNSFKQQLKQSTKTPDELWMLEMKSIGYNVNKDYESIKYLLKYKAENGQYVNRGNEKHLFLEYECEFLSKCIDRKNSTSSTGRIGTSRYKQNAQSSYHIGKENQYNYYLKSICDLGKVDDISIKPIFKEVGGIKKYTITMPYTSNDRFCLTNMVKVYLECSICY